MKIIKKNVKAKWGQPWEGKLIPGNTTWNDKPVIGMDTETTSVDPMNARLVTSAIVLDIPGQEPIVNEWLINPDVDIPLNATAIHGISTEHAREYGRLKAEVINEMMIAIMAYQEQYNNIAFVMVNAPYDLCILNCEMQRSNMGMLNEYSLPPIIDTLCVDRKIDPYRRGRRTLTSVSASYNVTIKGAHTAAGDVICSIKLARAMADKYPELANADLDNLQKLQSDAYDEWIKNYESYRRLDEPDFKIFGQWPYPNVTI